MKPTVQSSGSPHLFDLTVREPLFVKTQKVLKMEVIVKHPSHVLKAVYEARKLNRPPRRA
jgi:hypothetical protein